jgi:DNA-binding beta-propeller fold protein YncE
MAFRGVLVCGLMMAVAGTVLAQAPLKLVDTIPLPGAEGRLGHPGIDLVGQRVFVPAATSNSVEVVSLASKKVVGSIKGLSAPQSALYLPDRKRIVVANRDDGTIRFFDGLTLVAVSSVNRTFQADRLRYHDKSKSVLASYGTGGIVVLDGGGKILADIQVGSHPEGFEAEPNGNRVFINDFARKSVLLADRTTGVTGRTWPLSTVASTSEMALDEANRRLFVAGRRPGKLVALDLYSGIQMDERETLNDAGALFYDGVSKRIYVIGNAEIDVISQRNPNSYEGLARVPTRRGARTGLYVPQLNRIFVPAAKSASEPAVLLVYEVLR